MAHEVVIDGHRYVRQDAGRPIRAFISDGIETAIDEAHPLKTKRHDRYQVARELVSARHAKGDLIDLVNYLLSLIPGQ